MDRSDPRKAIGFPTCRFGRPTCSTCGGYPDTLVSGTSRVSQVLVVSLNICHALKRTPAEPRNTHHCAFSVWASGSTKPSPSAFGWLSPSGLITGLHQASGSAVFLVAYVVPCARFNEVVQQLMQYFVSLFPGSLELLTSLLQRQGFLSFDGSPLTNLSYF